MFCIKCGQQLDEDSKFCYVCGAKTEPENIPQEDVIPPPQVNSAAMAAPVQIPTQPAPVPVPTPPVISAPQHVQAYEKPQDEEIVYVTSYRNIFLALAAVVLLAAIIVTAVVVVRRRSDVSVTTPPAVHVVQTPGPAASTEVSLRHIERVFYGRLMDHPGATIGAAFSRYFTDYSWDHFLDGATNTVSFFGIMQRAGDVNPIGVQIYFMFTPGDADFDATGLILDNQWQEITVLHELLDSIFENAD